MDQSHFDIQELKVKSRNWEVALNFESYNIPEEHIEEGSDIEITLSEEENCDSRLKISINSETKFVIKGIQGGVYLHSYSEEEKSQTVKIEEDSLILSLGSHFVSIDLKTSKLNWKLKPDFAEVFEFYDLEQDYLLRGELQIYRIDKQGNIKWAFSGRDIWINMEGKNEVQIKNGFIQLFDFNSEEYLIDYSGRIIKN